MKKKIFSIWSVLLILAVSIAIVVPGCDGACTGDIEVKATICDAPWEGDVEYTLTLPGATAPTIIDGTSVNATHSGVECGNWTCEYVSGGPPDAYLVDITLDPTQEVTSGGTITFTLNFELDQDAWINFETWTVDGDPDIVYYELGQYWAEVVPCNIIDVHFQQGVEGCEEYAVNVTETSRLWIHYMGHADEFRGELDSGNEVGVYVVNDLCAVNKTAEPPANPPEKVSQQTTHWGDPVLPDSYLSLTWSGRTELDVETIWMLEKEIDYTKSINWLGISIIEPMPHPCVLFELVVPLWPMGYYVFQVSAEAEVVLMDDTDVDTGNNNAVSLPLNVWVWTGE